MGLTSPCNQWQEFDETPFATNRVLNLFIEPYEFFFILKTHLLPKTFISWV